MASEAVRRFEILTRSPHLLFCKRVGNGANKQMHRRRLSGSRLQDERGHLQDRPPVSRPGY